MGERRYTIQHQLPEDRVEYLKEFNIGNNKFSIEWTTKLQDCLSFIEDGYPKILKDLIQWKAPGADLKVVHFEIHIGKKRYGKPLYATCFCHRNGFWDQDEKQKGQCKHCKKPIITK